MSTVIDNKVVEMTFDNKQFERETKTTMKTLDQLKKELNFDQSVKSLDSLNKAAQKVDFNGMAKSIDQVSVKLSAMEVIGTTALVNLTNKVVNAGEKLVKSMTIDQVTAGWQKYADKTASVQTLLNSTGKSLGEINKYLATLQWYSDETSYGFTDMTQALSTMTIAGGKIEKLVPMIMGVANATAFAGKGPAQFKSIMYNLSQSYSKGALQTIDWKSVTLMGGASVQLKEALMQSAKELKKIKKDAKSTNFDVYLSKGFFTNDVMEKAFEKFSDYTVLMKDIIDDYDENAEAFGKWEVNATTLNSSIIPGIMKLKKEGKMDELKKNYSAFLPYLEKIEKVYNSLGDAAFHSAQEAKTFSEAIEATKDAVSSQFAQIFEAIFGDYYKAKKLWTAFVNWLYDVVVRPIESLREKIEAIMSYSPIQSLKDFASALSDVEDKVGGAAKGLDYYQKMVNSIWRGDWKNQPYRKGLLEKEGHNFKVLQTLVNLGYKHKLTTKEVAEAEKKYGKGIVDATKKMDKLSDAELKKLGLDEEQIHMYRALQKEAKASGKTVKQVLDDTIKEYEKKGAGLTGRDLFIGIFTNIGNALTAIFMSVKKAFSSIFGKSEEEAAESAWGILKSIYDITLYLKELFERVGETTKSVDEEGFSPLTRTLRGLFAAIDLIITVLNFGVKIAFGIFTGVLKALGFTIEHTLDITAALGDAIVAIRDFLKNNVIAKIIETIVYVLVGLISTIIDFIKTCKPLTTLINNIKKIVINFFNSISKYFKSDKVKKVLDNISKALSTALGIALMYLGKVISKTVDWITHNETILKIVNAIKDALSKAAKSVKDWIKSGDAGNAVAEAFNHLGKALVWVINTMAKGINATIKWAKNNKTLQKIVKTLGEYLSIVFKTIGKWLSKVDFVGIFTKIGKTISNIAIRVKNWIVNNTKLVDGLKAVWEWLKKSAESFATWFSGIKEADNIPKYIISGLVNGLKNGLGAVITAIGALASGLIQTFAKLLGIHSPSTVFMNFGLNIGEGLINGIKNIWSLCTGIVKALGQSIIGIFKNLDIGSVLATIITIGAVVTLNRVSKALMNFSKPFAAVAGILSQVKNTVIVFNDTLKAVKVEIYAEAAKSIATAVLLLAGAIFILSKIDVAKAWIAVGMIATIMAAIAAIIFAIGYMSSKQDIRQVGIFAGTIAAIAGLMTSIGLMAIMMAIAFRMMEKVKDPFKTAAAIFLPIFAFIALILFAIKRIKPDELVNSVAILTMIGNFISKIAKLVLILAIAIKIVSSVPRDKFKIAEEFMILVGAFIGILALIVIASGKLKITDAKKLDSVSNLAKSMSTMVLALAATVILLSKLSANQWKDGALRLGIILGLVAVFYLAIIAINKIGDKGVKKSSIDGISKMIAAIAILAVVVGILGIMSLKTLAKGILALGIIEGFVIALYLAISAINSTVEKGKGDASKSIIRVAMAIAIIAAVAVVLGLMNPSTIAKGMKVVAEISALVAALMYTASLIKPGTEKSIFGIAAILAILTIAVVVLGNMKTEKLAAGVIALSALMGMLILVFKSIKSLSISKSTITGLLALAAIMAVLGLVLFAVSFLPAKQTIPAAIALGVLLGVLILSLKQLTKIKIKDTKNMITTLLALTVITALVIGLAVALAIAGISSWDSTISAAAGLSLLLATMVTCLTVLSKSKGMSMATRAMIKTVAMLAILVAAIVVLALALNLIKDPKGAIESAVALSILLIAMTVVLVALGALSSLVSKALIGVVGLLGLALVLGLVAEAIIKLNGIQNTMEIVKSLSVMLLVFTGVLAILSVIGVGAAMALAGIVVMAAVIAAIIGISLLLDKLIKNDKNLVRGLDLLILIAGKIGEAIGAFIKAIAKSILDLLPLLGLALSQFAVNATPFIMTMKLVDLSVLEGIGILVASILALCVAEIFSAITKIFSLGGSFADLGTELSNFARNSEDFINYGKNIPENLATNMLNLGKAILAIAAGDFLDKLSQKLFGGDNAIKRFSDNLPLLGEGLRSFVDSLGNFSNDNVKTVDCASQAISKLAKASKDLPRSGGFLQKLVGEKNLGKFTKNLKPLGEGINNFRKALGGKFSDKDAGVVANAADAVASLAKAAKNIPESDGEWQKKYGGKDLGNFAKDISETGEGLRVFRNKIGDWDKNDLKMAQNGAELVSTFAQSARMIIGSVGAFSYSEEKDGEHIKSLSALSKDIPTIGNALKEFVEASPDTSIENYTEKIKNFERIIKFMDSLNNILAVDFISANVGGKLATVQEVVQTLIVESITSIAEVMGMLSDLPYNMEGVDNALANIEKVLTLVEKITKLDHKAIHQYADDIRTITSSALAEEVESVLNLLSSDKELDTSDKKYKAFEEHAKKVGEAVVKGINNGINKSKDLNLISENIMSAISTALKVLGTGKTDDKLLGFAQTVYSISMEQLGINIINYICDGIKSKTSKENITKAFDVAMQYVAAQIKSINYESFTASKLGLKISEFAVKLNASDKDIKQQLTTKIKEALANIITDIDSNIEVKAVVTPVINWDEITKGKMGRLNNLITVNTNLNANLEALKKSFGTEIQNQTTKIINKLDEVNKSVKDIDSSENYTINIDGKVLASNPEINGVVENLTKALEKYHKTGNTGGA